MQQKPFSVILSDMCPLVSGITTRDAALSVELGMQALDLAVGRATLHSLDDNVQKEKEMVCNGHAYWCFHGWEEIPKLEGFITCTSNYSLTIG